MTRRSAASSPLRAARNSRRTRPRSSGATAGGAGAAPPSSRLSPAGAGSAGGGKPKPKRHGLGVTRATFFSSAQVRSAGSASPMNSHTRMPSSTPACSALPASSSRVMTRSSLQVNPAEPEGTSTATAASISSINAPLPKVCLEQSRTNQPSDTDRTTVEHS